MAPKGDRDPLYEAKMLGALERIAVAAENVAVSNAEIAKCVSIREERSKRAEIVEDANRDLEAKRRARIEGYVLVAAIGALTLVVLKILAKGFA